MVDLGCRASPRYGTVVTPPDLYLHYQDGVRGARRVEWGTKVAECPYPGLASFDRDQARWFFGRDQLTAELRWERIGGSARRASTSGSSPLAVVQQQRTQQLPRDN
jgi:hypothetical protein